MPKGNKWLKVDTDTFEGSLKTSFNKFVSAFDALDTTEADFQHKAREHLNKTGKVPEGKAVAFNYTGKVLMLAFVDPKEVTNNKKVPFGF